MQMHESLITAKRPAKLRQLELAREGRGQGGHMHRHVCLQTCYTSNLRVVRVSDKAVLVCAWAAEEGLQALD